MVTLNLQIQEKKKNVEKIIQNITMETERRLRRWKLLTIQQYQNVLTITAKCYFSQ